MSLWPRFLAHPVDQHHFYSNALRAFQTVARELSDEQRQGEQLNYHSR